MPGQCRIGCSPIGAEINNKAIDEKSLTEYGSITDPDFKFWFSDIKIVDAKK